MRRAKRANVVLAARGEGSIGVLGRTGFEDCGLALIVARGAKEQARRCNDAARRVLEYTMDLELRSDLPTPRPRRLIAVTREIHDHPRGWVELAVLLEMIDRFERIYSAVPSGLIALGKRDRSHITSNSPWARHSPPGRISLVLSMGKGTLGLSGAHPVGWVKDGAKFVPVEVSEKGIKGCNSAEISPAGQATPPYRPGGEPALAVRRTIRLGSTSWEGVKDTLT